MGTKNNPGNYDYYAKAKDDEPMFILLARDPMAPVLVRLWADIYARSFNDFNEAKYAEACKCASEMTNWYQGPIEILELFLGE